MIHSTYLTTNQQRQVVGVSSDRAAGHALSEVGGVPLSEQFAVGFFSSLSDLEYAVIALRSVRFPLNQITLVANHFRRQDQFSGVKLCDRFEATGLAIAEEQVRVYQERWSYGDYMMIVQGTEDELNRAASMLNHRGIQEWRMYS